MMRNANIRADRLDGALSAPKGMVRAAQPSAGVEFPTQRIDAGTLVLPTGRLCVADAYAADGFPPLALLVPEGEFPVEIVVASLPKRLRFGGDRCAFVVVTFSASPIESWNTVTAVAPAGPCFTDAAPNAFVQEGATGVFAPEAGAEHYTRLSSGFDEYIGSIRRRARRVGTVGWLNFRPGSGSANMIICDGGFGDGTYECFAGFTGAGRATRLVLDFGIFDPAPLK